MAAEQFEANGLFPVISRDDLDDVLSCLLYLGFDAFIKDLVPTIAQNVRDLRPDVFRQFPMFLKLLVGRAIPCCKLDPDFVIEHFGFEVLAQRVQSSPAPKFNHVPFEATIRSRDDNPIRRVANALLYYDARFSEYRFVRENATEVVTKGYIDLSHFAQISELTIFQGSIDGVALGLMLNRSITCLKVIATKLSSHQVDEILEFITRGSLRQLVLRDVKLNSLKCRDVMKAAETCELELLDISGNGLGSVAIGEVIDKANVRQLAIGDNFFEPSANAVRKLVNAPCHSISIRGMHWDEASAEVVAGAMKVCAKAKCWDLSAQTIHKHSDPDMGPDMLVSILSGAGEHIESLILANHRLEHIDLQCLAHINLKSLSLSNTCLQESSLGPVLDAINRLEVLDLSDNAIVFKNSMFLTAAGSSPSLRQLILSDNPIGDTSGRILFDTMLENESRIYVLRLRNCFLKRQSSQSLLRLLRSGRLNFDELDIAVNDMFKKASPDTGPFRQSRVDRLIFGSNDPGGLPLYQLLDAVTDTRYINLDRSKWSSIVFCQNQFHNVTTLAINFTKISNDGHLVRLVSESGLQCLWIVNAVSERILSRILSRFAEMPCLMSIHVGPEFASLISPIPITVEYR